MGIREHWTWCLCAGYVVLCLQLRSELPRLCRLSQRTGLPRKLACEVGEVALWLGGRSGVGEEAKRQASEVTCETVKTIRSYENFGRTSVKVGDILEKERVLINLAAFRRAAPQ